MPFKSRDEHLGYQREYYKKNADSKRAYRRRERLMRPEKSRGIKRRSYAINRETKRARDLRVKYGLTPFGYAELLFSQGGACAICKATPKRSLHVDHCHSTGHTRGLLCDSCNLALGHFKDDPELLGAAARYVRDWSVRHASMLSRPEQAVLALVAEERKEKSNAG